MEDYTTLNRAFGIDAPIFLPEEENIEYFCKYTSPMLGKKLSKETKRLLSDALKGRVFSDESREKMSKSARARGVSEACRAASAKASRKEWTIQHPCGRIEKVHGGRQFCLKHNLNYNTFKNLMNGHQKQHKGYRVL